MMFAQTSVATAGVVAVAAASGAVVLGGWLAVRSLGAAGLPGCGAGSGCEAVTRGRWSRVGPVPVAGLGAAAYLVLLLASGNAAGRLGPRTPATGEVAAAAAVVVIGAAVWFTALQVFVIRRLCRYCMAAHLLACLAAVVLLVTGRPWATAAWPIELAVAVTLVAVLILAQVLLTPKTFAVTAVPTVPSGPQAPEGDLAPPAETGPASAVAPSTATPAHRRVGLLGGQVVLNTGGWPLLGRPDAQHVIAALFDFTCTECHHLRRLLAAAVEVRPDWLAVALVPVPLHPACNPAVTCTREARAQACDYARLAWAVWLAGSNDHFARWDTYVRSEAEGQPYGLALVRAGELVDLRGVRLGEDPRLARAVATGVGLYRAAGEPKVPAVLLPASILQGHLPDLTALLTTLDAHLPRAAELPRAPASRAGAAIETIGR